MFTAVMFFEGIYNYTFNIYLLIFWGKMFSKNDKAAFESFDKEILHYIYFLNKKSNIFHSYGYIKKLKKKNDYIKNSHHHKSCCMLAKVKKSFKNQAIS